MLRNPLKIRHHSLTGRITYTLVYQAFLNVKRNLGAAGVDKQSILDLVKRFLKSGVMDNGLRFVRYADDFVVLCQSEAQAKEAMDIVDSFLRSQLELELSPEKTHVTSFSKGFTFLGFDISSRSIRMRDKSIEKFKDKIRSLSIRSHNLDDDHIERLNQVIRGMANYFATPFSHNRTLFKHLDQWIRMRLRCMKYKRKWKTDNRRLRVKHIRNKGVT